MKIKIKRVIFAILIIVNCIAIFNLSAQNSETSSKTSGVFVDKVVDTIANVNNSIEKDSMRDTVTFLVRKAAHFSIYTILGIFLMNEANTFIITRRKKIILCIIFGFLYALSDEFHQSFVGGRSAEIRDVCIDTCGVIFGIILVILFCRIVACIRKTSLNNT